MYKFYKINLKNQSGSSQTSVNYKLLDNEAVDVWSNGPLKSYKEGKPTEWSLTVSLGSHFNKTANRLNYYVDKFNLGSGAKEERLIPRFEYKNKEEDTKLLNTIHALFEEYGNNIEFGSANPIAADHSSGEEITEYLEKINKYVHLTEDQLKNKYKVTTGQAFSTGYICLASRSNKIELPSSLKKYFQLSSKFGDLFLNYATRGKCLLQIFRGNDLPLLEGGGKAAPQGYISAGILSNFSGLSSRTGWPANTGTDPDEVIKARFDDWFDRNDVSRFGYSKNDINNCLGTLKVGEFTPLDFQTKWTYGEINNYYSEYTEFDGVEVY